MANKNVLQNLEKSFLRVSSQATIGHVQRFLDRKLNTSQLGQVCIFAYVLICRDNPRTKHQIFVGIKNIYECSFINVEVTAG